MKFLNKLQRKYGRYAISNLSAYIIALYAAGYLIQIVSPDLLNYLTLEPYYILHGQIWRLLTWLIIPPSSLGFFTVIMLYFYYSVGQTLERTWGAFRYNVYIFGGILGMVIGSFILYGILYLMNGAPVSFGSLFTTYYINMSILLAFASTYSDTQVYLYFLVPIKMKWLGIFYGVILILNFAVSNWIYKIMMLMSMLNFIVYFIGSKKTNNPSYKQMKRQWEYKKTASEGADRYADPYETTRTKHSVITRHKCAVCGRTELDGDYLEFRFCSKCDGNYEYCQDHIFTHEHVKRQ